ncbi:threonine-phosphate decarboxylase CobD [Nitrospina sp. 32_T5]|uniref:threonine-phosphate decarboxylase CobD n=1 Tax=unclassified Nitrospina TaxID=2638683 RepID=UPI003F9BA2BE
MNHHSRQAGFSSSKESADTETLARTHPLTCFLPDHGGALPPFWNDLQHEDGNWLDFSTSIHPWGPSEQVCKAIGKALAQVQRYPDASAFGIKQALSESLSISVSQLMVGNGATELIYLLPHLLSPGKEVLIVEPFFSEFKKAFRAFGIPVHSLLCDRENLFAPPMDRLIDHVEVQPNLGAVVLGHPNSPTGQLCPREAFARLARVCEAKRILLIVDESFIDFCEPGTSFLTEYASHPQLILIRSMTKFHGLAGLRLGFAVLFPERARMLSGLQPPWSVNHLAQAAGVAALMDKTFAKEARQFIRKQRRHLFQGLESLPLVEPFLGNANFILFRLADVTEASALELYYRLLGKGILIRSCANFEGLDASYFRVSVRLSHENGMLVAGLKECLDDIQKT